MILKKIEGWPFVFGGQPHSGWLPPNAAIPLPTPIEEVLLDVFIEQENGGYYLIWSSRTKPADGPPKSGDSWHETLEDAETQARLTFGIEDHHWN